MSHEDPELSATSTNWRARLAGLDVRSLATLRILLGLILLVDWTQRWRDFDAFYSDAGMMSVAASRVHYLDPGRWSLNWLADSDVWQHSLFAGALVAAACLLVGWRTRVATFASWLFVVSIWHRNPLVCNYGDTWLRLLLFWTFFLPLGATWSVDAWRRARRGLAPAARQVVVGAPSVCLVAQLSLLYFFAGLWKWNDAWLSGAAVFDALQIEYARRATSAYLLQWPSLLGPLTQATLALELLGPLVIWSPWRTNFWRLAMIGAFLLLHVAIEICFRPLMLSYVSMAAWFMLVPTAAWESRWLAPLGAAWDRLLARARRAAADASPAAQAAPVAAPGPDRGRLARVADVVCLSALVFVVLWNIASFDPERLGFVVPPRARPLGYATMLWQTWDMFYVPQRRNGWLVAEARRRDGRTIDLLNDERPFERDRPASNWDAMPNPRWRLFFDRLGTEPQARYHRPVAAYLLRTADARRSGDERLVRVDLIYVERTTRPDDDSPGYRARVVASVRSPDAPQEESIEELFEAFDRDLRRP